MESGILDNVSRTQQGEILRTFHPQAVVLDHLNKLPPREKQVMISRFGLLDGQTATLEKIGQELNLTRERIRQIERDATKKLKGSPFPVVLERDIDLIFDIIESHGGIAKEESLLALLLPHPTSATKLALLFILNIAGRFYLLKESPLYHTCWYINGFDLDLLHRLNHEVQNILNQSGKPLSATELFMELRNQQSDSEIAELSDELLENLISVFKKIDKNPFGEWGLVSWPQIRPKDVGDKAYLVLRHAGKPTHFAKITELINKQKFDLRQAHRETVHNELIKDSRFVLIGRGIYALKVWGYKKGTVADVIQAILQQAGRPLSKQEIISEVLKQRMVKTNTIIVGLSNRNLFQKTADNKYTLK